VITFLTSIYDYWLAVSADNYSNYYRIISRTSGTEIIVLDPEDTLDIASGLYWAIKGYPKDALLNLIEYTLFF
jgi:hypothetical protein